MDTVLLFKINFLYSRCCSVVSDGLPKCLIQIISCAIVYNELK